MWAVLPIPSWTLIISSHILFPLTPPCESNNLVRVPVSATFGTMSYFAVYEYPPLSEQQWVLFPSNFGISVLLSQGRGGDGVSFSQCIAHHCFSQPSVFLCITFNSL